MEKIKIYCISPLALKIYKENTKHGKNASKEVIERKLSALIYNAQIIKQIMKDKFACRFGNFGMIVNNKTKHIEVCYWENRPHKLTKFAARKLEKTYKQLGLSRSGNSYKKGKLKENWIVLN